MSNPGGNRSDNEATKVIFHKTVRDERTTTIVPERGGDETVFKPVQSGAQTDPSFDPVVGWLVIVGGPGRGNFRPIRYGQNAIGRGENLPLAIDYGDLRISREPHAFLIYDEVKRAFYLRDNGKSNIVRLNGDTVLTPSELRDRDTITIGQTTLLFIALCDASFDWLSGNAANPA